MRSLLAQIPPESVLQPPTNFASFQPSQFCAGSAAAGGSVRMDYVIADLWQLQYRFKQDRQLLQALL